MAKAISYIYGRRMDDNSDDCSPQSHRQFDSLSSRRHWAFFRANMRWQPASAIFEIGQIRPFREICRF